MTQPSAAKDAPALTPEEARMQRILKFVVAGLGVLILVVLGAMVMMIVGGGKGKGHDVSLADNVTAMPAAAPSAPFSHDISIPPRAMVIESRVDGSTLILRLSTEDGSEEIMVIDMPTGAVKGRIGLKPAD